jgi:prevent-host-death family protein
MYISGKDDPDKRRVFDHPGLRVTATSPRHIFAMKALAARTRDIDDLRVLAEIIAVESADAAMRICAEFYLDEAVPQGPRPSSRNSSAERATAPAESPPTGLRAVTVRPGCDNDTGCPVYPVPGRTTLMSVAAKSLPVYSTGCPVWVGERIGEAVAEIEPGRMPPPSISPPAAHRTVGQVSIDGDDADLCVAKEPVDNIRLAAAARGGDRRRLARRFPRHPGLARGHREADGIRPSGVGECGGVGIGAGYRLGREVSPERAVSLCCRCRRAVPATVNAQLYSAGMTYTCPVSQAGSHLAELVDRARRSHERVVLTEHGQPAAVLISVDDLDELQRFQDDSDIALCQAIDARDEPGVPHDQFMASLDME